MGEASVGEPQRAYRITWRGDSHVICARSRSAARYASWKAFLEAGYRADLPTFAGMIRIERAALASTEPHASSEEATDVR